jgi:ABC-type transport system involved in cytochrome c biogenesis permease component
MATAEQDFALPTTEPAATAGDWRDRLDAGLVWIGDGLNPILVKETRQALKSRQFVVTFILVLALAWGWSIFGVAWAGPSIRYSASGLYMFSGYYVILAVPLMVIVPFGAFRSLASEREDGTFELLSVTTLRPRQIVSGKLGSAVVQMLVYLSAVAPCLAFTYMLKGIDVPTIFYVLAYSFLGSLGLSMVGLVVSTITSEKHWQVLVSVGFLFGLAMALYAALALVWVELRFIGIPFQSREFWYANGMIQTAFWSYFALCFFAASGQLSFPSDNRSTRLRIVMIVQQALLTGWVAWGLNESKGEEPLILIYLVLSALHWTVMGALMNGELGEMSLRVRRQLPGSFLGRALFTWFNPGPATGYIFTAANLLATLLMATGLLVWGEVNYPGTHGGPAFGASIEWVITCFGVVAFSYILFYLGVGRLVISQVRRFTPVSLQLSFLLHVLMVLAGCLVPLSIHWMMPNIRNDYSLLEITNPFYSLAEFAQHPELPDMQTLLWLVPAAAFLVLMLNLPAVVRAVGQVRIAKPPRLEREEAEEAALHAAPPLPTSPFDD